MTRYLCSPGDPPRNGRQCGLALLTLLLAGASLGGCDPNTGADNGNDNSAGGGSAIDPENPPVTGGAWFKPETGTTWQWQLQPNAAGMLNTTYDVDAYDVDLFETNAAEIAALQAAGRRVICYFSAGSYEGFRPDAGDFPASVLGSPLAGFADERWLDIRSDAVRQIVSARLDQAVDKGCDCVEPDNVDGYANDSGFDLSAADQLAFNRYVANQAHLRGLCVGLKNDLDQVPQLVEYFDFALNEQCHEYDECELLAPFVAADKAVFNAEYADAFVNDAITRAALCAESRAARLQTLVLPLELDDAFRLSCEE